MQCKLYQAKLVYHRTWHSYFRVKHPAEGSVPSTDKHWLALSPKEASLIVDAQKQKHALILKMAPKDMFSIILFGGQRLFKFNSIGDSDLLSDHKKYYCKTEKITL